MRVFVCAAALVLLTCATTLGNNVQLDQEFWYDQVSFISSYGSLSSLERDSFGLLGGASQTFTVGVAGTLNSIEVYVPSEYGDLDEDPRRVPTLMRILQTQDGVPIGGLDGSVVLASSNSVVSNGPNHTFDLSPSNFSVAVGDVFAIELFGLPGEIGTAGLWGGVSGGPPPFERPDYEGGEGFGYSDISIVYPEPGQEDTTEWRSVMPSPNTVATHSDRFFRTFVATANATAVPEPASIFCFAIVALIPCLKLLSNRRKSVA